MVLLVFLEHDWIMNFQKPLGMEPSSQLTNSNLFQRVGTTNQFVSVSISVGVGVGVELFISNIASENGHL